MLIDIIDYRCFLQINQVTRKLSILLTNENLRVLFYLMSCEGSLIKFYFNRKGVLICQTMKECKKRAG